MKSIQYTLVILTIALFALTYSCGHKHSEGDGHDHGSESDTHSDDDGHDHGHEEGLHLTKEQAVTIGLDFGELSSIKVNDFIKATGTLGLPPNGYFSVSPKSDGIIKRAKKYVEGNYIKKGEVIAYLENPAFITKQQEYLETVAQLKLKRLDVERQQSLVNENAGVTKSLQNAEAEVAVLIVKSTGLSKQLAYWGISTANLTPNSIRQQISIVAPMSGYISSINFHNGVYAQSTTALMDIISAKDLHLELDVFEKDIVQVKEGQQISFTVPALGQDIYQAEVSVIGREFNSQVKTVRIYGRLEGDRPMFLKDLFVNAKIWLNDNVTEALPEKAIINDGASSFIYVAKNEEGSDEIEFEKINVIAGATVNGFTSVKLIDTIPHGMRIVTKGAYYVYAQSKAGELAHEH